MQKIDKKIEFLLNLTLSFSFGLLTFLMFFVLLPLKIMVVSYQIFIKNEFETNFINNIKNLFIEIKCAIREYYYNVFIEAILFPVEIEEEKIKEKTYSWKQIGF